MDATNTPIGTPLKDLGAAGPTAASRRPIGQVRTLERQRSMSLAHDHAGSAQSESHEEIPRGVTEAGRPPMTPGVGADHYRIRCGTLIGLAQVRDRTGRGLRSAAVAWQPDGSFRWDAVFRIVTPIVCVLRAANNHHRHVAFAAAR